ncbi:MAG: T9SS type A sorting domain-containing protein [Bacteroidota bacterium]
MKRLLLLQIIVTIGYLGYAQDWTKSNVLLSDNNIDAIKTIADSDNNIIIYGNFSESMNVGSGEDLVSYGGTDYFIAKFDTQSELVWIKKIGSRTDDFFDGGISVGADNSIYLTGGFNNYLFYSETDSIQNNGKDDIFLAKLNKDGDFLWCKNAGTGAQHQRPTTIQIDNSDNILLAGYFKDSITIYNDTTIYADNSFKDYFYSKFNSDDGGLIWAKSLKSINSNRSGFIYTIIPTDTEYFFVGVFADSIIFGHDTIVSLTPTYYDTHLFSTDLSGNINWLRKIQGDVYAYTYTISLDLTDNLYITGYYNSQTLTIDSTETETVQYSSNKGGFDFFIAKYTNSGNLEWFRANGGIGDDRLIYSEIFEGDLHVTGYFSDTLQWGGIQLFSNGETDQDMFIASIDSEGNYRNANSFSGRNNSSESGQGVFNTTDNLYSVIHSNSDLLVIGDSIYTSTTGSFYIVMGVIGCLPISIDNIIKQDVSTCYGDSTGSLQVLATGGFGAPWQYSIDNGLSYSELSYFGDLPAGDYPVVVIDKEGCAQPGNIETVNQPDTLVIESVTFSDITADADGLIEVAASGGSSPYTFTLQPVGTVQGFGTFTFGLSDSGVYYVEVNDLQNCGPVTTDSITINNVVGIYNYSDLQVKVFPNPTSGIMTLEMPFEGMEATMEVLSLTGQVMVSRQVYSSGGVIREKIDLSDLAKGMYMLRVDGQTLKSGVVVN